RSPKLFHLAYARTNRAGCAVAVRLVRMTALKPWISPFWKEVVTGVDAFCVPNEGPTLEAGKENYITDLGDGVTRVSQGLTTKSDSSPKFIDITRTKYYIALILQNAIASYRIATEKIPYTAAGLKFIEGELKGAMESVKALGAISDYSITMPLIDDIDPTDIQNRKLSGVRLWGKLAGDMQEFDMDLMLEAI
ncbi:hypothetical protein, partial [Methanoregula sp.]|uniref:hypothetical protein n=1 Tax=Methanoregula sp. TaxID=2052170 RepID=UPI000CC9F7AA